MKIVLVSVILNVHQVNLADELYRLCGGGFHFIQTGDNTTSVDAKGGTSNFDTRPYLIKTTETKTSEVLSLIDDADAVIFGAAPLFLIKNRIKNGGLTFWYSERWLKKGIINLLSPQLLKQQIFYHRYCHTKPVYALCASAYAAKDYRLMRSYMDKCFKWGYFTKVSQFDIAKALADKSTSKTIRILWIGRFLDWKHPELMIDIAKALAKDGYNISIDMIGSGDELKTTIINRVVSEGLEEFIKFPDPVPNEQLTVLMRDYHIFCFTSNRREGWGAVLGEAMSAGCCPIASVECGSTPYLVKDGINGLIFQRTKPLDLLTKVKRLIDNPEERTNMSLKAYKTMVELWNPTIAAENIYKLSEALLSGQRIHISDGPCSKA